MIGYFGFYRDAEVRVDPLDMGCGAGSITCIECGGDGDWTKFLPDELIAKGIKESCVVCKGTGKSWISI